MRNLRAMVEIVQIVWAAPNNGPLSAGVTHSALMDVVTDHLELMVEGFVDDYTAKLEQTAVE
jgi:hypothetical protein